MQKNSYDCKLTSYYDGSQKISVYSNPIVYDDKTYAVKHKREKLKKSYKNENRTQEQGEHCMEVSVNRTKNKIYDISRSNDWEWFVTLTFDRNRIDSSNYDDTVNKLSDFLSNIKKRVCPNMKYLFVPELHKDGIHYHFHGLLADCDGLDFVHSGRVDYKSQKPIYNIANWSWGFTTATQVESSERVSHYICKYITKDSEHFLANKKRYYSSRNCAKPQIDTFLLGEISLDLKDNVEFCRNLGDRITYVKEQYVPAAHQKITYYELKPPI